MKYITLLLTAFVIYFLTLSCSKKNAPEPKSSDKVLQLENNEPLHSNFETKQIVVEDPDKKVRLFVSLKSNSIETIDEFINTNNFSVITDIESTNANQYIETNNISESEENENDTTEDGIHIYIDSAHRMQPIKSYSLKIDKNGSNLRTTSTVTAYMYFEDGASCMTLTLHPGSTCGLYIEWQTKTILVSCQIILGYATRKSEIIANYPGAESTHYCLTSNEYNQYFCIQLPPYRGRAKFPLAGCAIPIATYTYP